MSENTGKLKMVAKYWEIFQYQIERVFTLTVFFITRYQYG